MTIQSNVTEAIATLVSVRGASLSSAVRAESAISLAGLILKDAHQNQTSDEFIRQAQLSRMMADPLGKAFTTAVADQCFRSKSFSRVADQFAYLLRQYGIPQFLTWHKKLALIVFQTLGTSFPNIFMPMIQRLVRRETSAVIISGETQALKKHLRHRLYENVRVNLNHLGEAILSEAEAQRRLQLYLDDLADHEIQYVSIKISTLCSQLNLLARDQTLAILAERLRQLYRAAQRCTPPKFVNLDMEEYRDLNLTIDLFKNILDESEFHTFSAGIVLQSYLPDSYLHQQELTQWALERVKKGGAPIKIRLVKGANLAMEQVESSLKGWPQAPYSTKVEADANFIRMMQYGCTSDRARAVQLGIGSHNLFDIAYALLLRAEHHIEPCVGIEMLEGMAAPLRRAVQEISGDMLLYCPVAKEEEFQYALAYLIRRLDENTAPENFLRHAFSMVYGDAAWNKQAAMFKAACDSLANLGTAPRRSQNRLAEPRKVADDAPFENEPDTDWSLPHNCEWAEAILSEWSKKTISPIPLVIQGKKIFSEEASGNRTRPLLSRQRALPLCPWIH